MRSDAPNSHTTTLGLAAMGVIEKLASKKAGGAGNAAGKAREGGSLLRSGCISG
jgi:hypothetical protein